MNNDHMDDRNDYFSYGVREIRAHMERELAIEHVAPKKADEMRGADPYNTSGSFDRKKNWLRVGKR